MCLWVCGSAGSVGLRGLWGVWGARKERIMNEQEAQERKRRVCGSVGLRGLWVCGSWVSARSGGLRARLHGGSGGLGSFGEEMRGKGEDKERKREALGAF